MRFPRAVAALGELLLEEERTINERKARGDKRYACTVFHWKYYAEIMSYRRAVRWLRMCGYHIEDVSLNKWWHDD